MTDEIEVTQADRNEAEKHWLWLLDDERDELVQGFARHRQAAFAEGFSAALQGAEAAIWRIEDDAFLYENVSKALQEVISELQAMEQNWTGRVSIEHAGEDGVTEGDKRGGKITWGEG